MSSFLIILLFSFIVSALCCLLHYEVLYRMQVKYLTRKEDRHITRMFIILSGLSFAHFSEILIYALAFYVMSSLGFGSLEGVLGGSVDFYDYLYFSVASYSTLGIGDIYPTDYLRLLTGVEGVVGLMLIAWSATFLYFHMEKKWLK